MKVFVVVALLLCCAFGQDISTFATDDYSGEEEETSTEAFVGDENYTTVVGDYEEDIDELEEENANTNSSFKPPQNPAEFMDYFEDLMKGAQNRLEEVFTQYMPQFLEMSSSVALSPDCTFDVIRVIFGIRQLKPWAIKMVDSSGKLPDGILGGTLAALGSYDECLALRLAEDEEDQQTATRGQYCAINIRPYLPPKPPIEHLEKIFNDAADAKGFTKEKLFIHIAPMFYFLKFRLGLCVPASCTNNDLEIITGSLSNRFRLNVTLQGCEVKDSTYLESDQLVPAMTLGLLLLIVISATVTDSMRNRMQKANIKTASEQTKSAKKTLMRCWLSFSMKANAKSLLSFDVPNDNILPVYGMRVLSLIWIIIAHAYLTLDFRATGRLIETRKAPKTFLFQIVLNASLAIETFFFLSGLLVSLTTLKKLSTSKWHKSNWVVFYIHRFIRMTPAIMLLIVILLVAYKVGDGPLWKEIIYPTVNKCRNNWWKHLFYISNFFEGKNMCFLHLWYIAADMQLFIFSPIFILLLYRRPKKAFAIFTALILASMVSTGIVTYANNLTPTLLFNNPDPSSRRAFGTLVLIKPYPHLAPYLIGIITGYLIHQKYILKFNRCIRIFGWLSTTAICLTTVFTTWEWNRGNSSSPAVTAIYAGCFRLFWALSQAWIILNCHFGFGGIVNSILSLPIFVPLSKLSYVAYLIHPGLMYISVASTRNLYSFSHYLVVQLFFSHITITFLVSFILSLIIELPFLSLENVLRNMFLKKNFARRAKLYPVTPCSSTDSSCSTASICNKINDLKYEIAYANGVKQEKRVCDDENPDSSFIFTCRL